MQYFLLLIVREGHIIEINFQIVKYNRLVSMVKFFGI